MRISRHNPLRDQLPDTAAVAAGVGPRKERLHIAPDPRVHVKSSQLDCENPEVQNRKGAKSGLVHVRILEQLRQE